ncbi:hypothetical protein [Tateyamaria sp. ANG-S1]|uniref:FliH/SctL family protein n=1 Tax=Tateyamaria sp. ANG-S1 TaxID=1577905 RepID=UPI00057CC2FB|nr:hypothetical protein [Tateyamaria sp. ANG-S1]KIC49622.1 hypothetical protein RA29_08090 [Tateyamaria sp. ANG-S1]
MMSAAHLFEDFGEKKSTSTDAPALPIEMVEDQKLEAFEKGYQAGWDDAVSAQSETQGFVSSGLASSLQDASFEYHELRASMTATVETVITNIIDIVLPQIARASLGAHVREKAQNMARAALDKRVEIAVAPENEAAVRSVLSDEIPEPFLLVSDNLLAPSQVVLRTEQTEVELDMDQTVAEISAAVTSFFQVQTAEVNDG